MAPDWADSEYLTSAIANALAGSHETGMLTTERDAIRCAARLCAEAQAILYERVGKDKRAYGAMHILDGLLCDRGLLDVSPRALSLDKDRSLLSDSFDEATGQGRG